MVVEKWDNRTNFPKFTRDDNDPRPREVNDDVEALAGLRQFTYEDHDSPWSVVAPNVDLSIGNLPHYHGTASFSGGTVAIQDNVPFWANMKATFKLDGTLVHLDHIEFETDGAQTVATGDVDLGRWPEQTYEFKSRVQFARMRQLFFKNEKWELSGEGDVKGTFHLFKGGRDSSGTFASQLLGLNEYRFPGLYGSLHWTPTLFDVSNAGAKFFDGNLHIQFSRSAPPNGRRHDSRQLRRNRPRRPDGVSRAFRASFRRENRRRRRRPRVAARTICGTVW